MRKKTLYILLFLSTLLFEYGCVTDNKFASTPEGNFEALWTVLDHNYCFFDLKKEKFGLDWDTVYVHYKEQIRQGMSERELFDVLASMVNELRDGHVNLITPFATSYYDNYYMESEPNFSYEFLSRSERYLAKDCYSTGGMSYKIFPDSIGYISYRSFSNTLSDRQILEILYYFRNCHSLIIDIRGNGGGDGDFAKTLAGFFTDKETLVGYMKHKTGPGRNDFSAAQPISVKPYNGTGVWLRPVAVLTNRQCFSAANDFANNMRYMPYCILIGQPTGGGGGFPFTKELPNGWEIRLSTAPTFDRDMNLVEQGIDPKIFVETGPDDYANHGADNIIEYARNVLDTMYMWEYLQ